MYHSVKHGLRMETSNTKKEKKSDEERNKKKKLYTNERNSYIENLKQQHDGKKHKLVSSNSKRLNVSVHFYSLFHRRRYIHI